MAAETVTRGHWSVLRLHWRNAPTSSFACGCGETFNDARDLVRHVRIGRGVSCWCCAVWGLSVPATQADQGGGYVCDRCHESSPSACKQRHVAEALAAARSTS